MTLQRKNEGFTIVELLIVIVVIGILAALVVTTFTGIQQRARNTERETDIKAVHGQLEAYYAQNGSYPFRDDVNNATWRSTNMKGLDAEALKDPKGTAQTLTATPGTSPPSYGYNPAQTDDSACTTAAGNCTKYTLTANLEGGGTFSKSSLN
jgi:prepilin-type N-terminal cleavage/methylation domain-containing protein